MKFFNRVLIFFIIIMVLLVVFVDRDSLNSLLICYDDIKVNEELVLNVNYMDVIHNDVVVHDENTTNTTNTTNTNTVQTVSNVVDNSWAWPTDGNYTITTYYSNSHKAIDIYSYNGYGSNAYAANNGVVSLVMGGCSVGDLSCNGRGGNYIVINHNNGYYTVYMHLKAIYVSTGQAVSRGQVIGAIGNTGNVIPVPTASAPYLGTHLHFALYVGEPYRGGYAINPMNVY